jgi:hypothetical protein
LVPLLDEVDAISDLFLLLLGDPSGDSRSQDLKQIIIRGNVVIRS